MWIFSSKFVSVDQIRLQPIKANLIVKTEPQSTLEKDESGGNIAENKRRLDIGDYVDDTTAKRRRIEQSNDNELTKNNSDLSVVASVSTHDNVDEEITVNPDILSTHSDYHFLMSLLQFLNKLDNLRNLYIRKEIYNLLSKEFSL